MRNLFFIRISCRMKFLGFFRFQEFEDLRNVKLSVVDDACNVYLACRMENEWFFQFLV